MISATTFQQMPSAMKLDIEERLDAAITSAGLRGRQVVTLAIESEWSYVVVEEVLSKYRAGGWDASIVTDSRDGDFISMGVRNK